MVSKEVRKGAPVFCLMRFSAVGQVRDSVLSQLNLPQPGITDAEVMGYLMPDHLPDLDSNITFVATPGLDGLLEDGNLVREHHPIASTAPGLRYPLVETEQDVATLQLAPGHLVSRRTVLDHHADILQPGEELPRQSGYNLSDQRVDPSLVHYAICCPAPL